MCVRRWVCLSVCLSVCLFECSRSKTAWAINTRLGTYIGLLYGSLSACIDPEVKKSKLKITQLQEPSRSHGWLLWPLCYCSRLRTAHRMTAWVSSCRYRPTVSQNDQILLPGRRYAGAVLAADLQCLCVCLSQLPVSYLIGCTGRAGFGMRALVGRF